MIFNVMYEELLDLLGPKGNYKVESVPVASFDLKADPKPELNYLAIKEDFVHMTKD